VRYSFLKCSEWHVLKRITQFYLPPHTWMEWTILPFLPSHKESSHFGRYSCPVLLRVGGWVGRFCCSKFFTAFSLATDTKNWCQVLVPVFWYQNLVPVSGTYVMGIRVRIVHRIFIPTPKRIQISQPATVYGYKIQYVTGWQQWTLYLCTLESIAHMTAIRQASEGSKCQDRARIWTNKLPVTYILAPVIARSSLTILRWRRRCENV